MVKETDAVSTEESATAAKLLTADEISREVKPLVSNGFLAFFQKIWRAWLGVWFGFKDRHPKAGKLIGQFVVMFIFSNLVTIWQLLVMLFLPFIFTGLNTSVFAWPGVAVGDVTWLQPTLDSAGKLVEAAGNYTVVPATFSIFGDTAGIGKWLAFEIAVFTAQCINFPLQRNITFRSNGNPVVQAIWYFIGWVAISFFVGAAWGICEPFANSWGWYYTLDAATNQLVVNAAGTFGATLLKTVITGGISMIIFFFIFLIIFPDANKVAKKARAKVDALKASNADAATIEKAELKATEKEEEAKLFNARTNKFKTISQSNSCAVAFAAVLRNAAKADAAVQTASEDKKAAAVAQADGIKARIPQYQQKASDAIAAKREALDTYTSVIAEVKAARQARGADISKIA